jgi:hypothetical protein
MAWLTLSVLASSESHADALVKRVAEYISPNIEIIAITHGHVIFWEGHGGEGNLGIASFDPQSAAAVFLTKDPKFPDFGLQAWSSDGQTLLFGARDGPHLALVDPTSGRTAFLTLDAASHSELSAVTGDKILLGNNAEDRLAYTIYDRKTLVPLGSGRLAASGSMVNTSNRNNPSPGWLVRDGDQLRIFDSALKPVGDVPAPPFHRTSGCQIDLASASFRIDQSRLVLMNDCEELFIFDLPSHALVATIEPIPEPYGAMLEPSFAVSAGYLFVLPDRESAEPTGRIYALADGKEVGRFVASGKLVGIEGNRLVTVDGDRFLVYDVDIAGIADPAAVRGRILDAYQHALASVASARTGYLAVEIMDEAGMADIVRDVLDHSKQIDDPLRPALDDYARWLAQSAQRYPEARKLIEALHPKDRGPDWTDLLARLDQLDLILARNPDDAGTHHPVEPKDKPVAFDGPGILSVRPIPKAAFTALSPTVDADADARLGGIAMDGGEILVASSACSPRGGAIVDSGVDVYDATSLTLKRRLHVDDCAGKGNGEPITAIAADASRIYVATGTNIEDKNPGDDQTGPSASVMTVLDRTTGKILSSFTRDAWIDVLDASTNDLIACDCSTEQDSIGKGQCWVLSKKDPRRIVGAANAINGSIGCLSNKAAMAAARLLGGTSQDRRAYGDDVNEKYLSGTASDIGSPGQKTEFQLLTQAGQFPLPGFILPQDGYYFGQLGNAPWADSAVVWNRNSGAFIVGLFNIPSRQLQPIVDFPDAGSTMAFAMTSAWLLASNGSQLIAYQMRSPHHLYIASNLDFTWSNERLPIVGHWLIERDWALNLDEIEAQ